MGQADTRTSVPPAPVRIVQRAGQLVGPPRVRARDVVETPASKALEVVAGGASEAAKKPAR